MSRNGCRLFLFKINLRHIFLKDIIAVFLYEYCIFLNYLRHRCKFRKCFTAAYYCPLILFRITNICQCFHPKTRRRAYFIHIDFRRETSFPFNPYFNKSVAVCTKKIQRRFLRINRYRIVSRMVVETHIYDGVAIHLQMVYPQTLVISKRRSKIKTIRRINNFRWNLACKINRYRKTMLIFTAEYLNRIRWYIWIFKCTFGNPILQFTHQVPTKMYSRNRTVISCRTRRL